MNDIDPHRLLGEFKSDHWFPRYENNSTGSWTLRVIAMAAARGYWGQVYRIAGTAVLTGPGVAGKAPWMSITPSEIESQEIGVRSAHGHTVVFGLGMGWLAANAALRSEVDHVTVVERDGDIISLVEASGVFAQLPDDARKKLEIVNADALQWKPSAPVDTLQADIWERFVEDSKLNDSLRMQDNVQAKTVYFWGQEMEIWRCACRRAGLTSLVPEPTLDWPLIRTIVLEDFGLPLILPDWPDFPQKIAAAAQWWTPREPGWWQVKSSATAAVHDKLV